MLKRSMLAATLLLAAVSPALAHVGAGATGSLAAGFLHPLIGLDHLAVMLAVGLWAALRGGRALWAWPAAFVAVMAVGGLLAMASLGLPFVEPVILASVVALGVLVALVVALPVAAGAVVIGAFALFHGHAHGTEMPVAANGLAYMAGFALATAGLHAAGIAAGLGLARMRWQRLTRAAGAACAAVGAGLVLGVL